MRIPIPSATVSRLPLYLRSLGALPPGQNTVSSEKLADLAGVNSAQVRKDLSFLGVQGVRGVGYVIESLRSQIQRALGLTRQWNIAIVGAGNLGTALANYAGFAEAGFAIVGIFDSSPDRIGRHVAGLRVEDVGDLDTAVAERTIEIAIIATPAAPAQEIVDRLVSAGVGSILNFAPSILRVPDGVQVRRVDLSTELQILSFHLHRGSMDIETGGGPVG